MSVNYEDLVAQAHRLLRVKWESPVSLAEELYAMLLPGIGTDIPGDTGLTPESVAPVQKRLAEAQQFFSNITQSATVQNVKATVEQPLPSAGWRSALVEGVVGLSAPPQREELPPPRIELPPQQPIPSPPFLTIPPVPAPPFISGAPPATMPFDRPTLVAVGPLAYSRPDFKVPGLPDVDWTIPIAPALRFGQETAGGGGILGRIVSGSGDTYTVDLYENGKNSAATQTDITVLIPQIDPDDVIPPDTWVAPIIQVTNDNGESESWYQPPIWLS